MLTTARLDLVEFELERDLAALHAMFSDPEWARGGFITPATSSAESRERLEREFGGNSGWTWVLRVRPDEDAVGVIGVFSDQGSSIRGISWYLRRDHWGAGLMSEAARAVVDHLLQQASITGIEAWIDSRNVRSIAVARHAGLDVVGRLPRTQYGEIAQSVVMGRAAQPTDPTTFGVTPTLEVRDVPGTVRLLCSLLGLQVSFELDGFALLGFTEWNGQSSLEVRRASGEISPATMTIDVGVLVDRLYDAAITAGLVDSTAPEDTSWYRRTFTLVLAEGHRLTISGPVSSWPA
ncbi:GNAT family N-acetyltransferase [Kribbella kalugense]|uniref:RimJ/RimL family protein N-acetyltransferase n=1 Tax=Kribbella kalugense TaxID=2512221 RepID=A0A4V3G8G3_9ACTN|nr:GNAT family N-acetyltransferase [Kribbella kalugense]TDW22844.1 RimJ/RimL family protein N-acetyltransferase [Kribbella kalugense]